MTQATQISATAPLASPFFGFDPAAMMQAFTAKMGEASASGSFGLWQQSRCGLAGTATTLDDLPL